jgi:hypothetical protein
MIQFGYINTGGTHPVLKEYKIQFLFSKYSETSIHRFRWGSEKETMDPGKQ